MLEYYILIIALVFIFTCAVFIFFIFKIKKDKISEITLLKDEIAKLKDKISLKRQKVESLENTTNQTSYVADQIYRIEQLEKELLQQKVRVQEAALIAQEASTIKDDFLANINHEIRTPMNSILVLTKILSKNLQDKKNLECVNSIFQSGNKLLKLLDDVIELSKMSSEGFKLEEVPIDIRGILEKIFEEKKKIANKKGLKLLLEIDKDVPKSFVCDGKKIENILLNLVDNGLKFTKTGFVKVKVQIKKEHPEHNSIDLLIIVEDSGVGIAKENRESIFNVFVKHEDTPDMLAKGLGIGLSINKKMVSVMNASLSVESKLGVGSRFTFLLNDLEVVLVSAEDETKDEYVDFSLVSSKDARVMVIDEDEETHQLIKDSFSASTVVEVLNFTDPRDAVAMFKKKKIDLIFIDIDILTIDENAFSKMIAMMSKAAVITLTQGSIKDIQFLEGGARVIGHLKRPISKVELFKLSMRELNTSSDLS